MTWYSKYTMTQIDEAIANGLRGSASLIHQASVTLDDDAIQAWPTTPVEIVPPTEILEYVGLVTKLPRLVSMTVIGTGWTTPYVGVNGSAVMGIYLGGPTAADFFDRVSMNIQASDLLTNNGYSGFWVELLARFETADTAFRYFDLFENLNDNGLYFALDNLGDPDLTGGDPSQTIKVNLRFEVYDLALNRCLTTVESGWDEDTRTFS